MRLKVLFCAETPHVVGVDTLFFLVITDSSEKSQATCQAQGNLKIINHVEVHDVKLI